MSNLLKEAIADAKTVRETAIANAKMALEEAFTPHLKSMLSAKLAEDDVEEGYGDKDFPASPAREEDDEVELSVYLEKKKQHKHDPYPNNDKQNQQHSPYIHHILHNYFEIFLLHKKA